MGLILHKGAQLATLREVTQVEVPEETASWKPVPYGRAIKYVKGVIEAELGLEMVKEEYGLGRNGKQLFAAFALKVAGETEMALTMGLRQSYDQSLSLGIVAGSSVLVCDNLCFAGSAFKVVRKNTTNVWRDFQQLSADQVKGSLGHFTKMREDTMLLKGVRCPQRRGFGVLGVALGEQIITPQQATIAYKQWTEPDHAAFEADNLWSLYNAMTEGLKKGPPGTVIDRYTAAHTFMMGIAAGKHVPS